MLELDELKRRVAAMLGHMDGYEKIFDQLVIDSWNRNQTIETVVYVNVNSLPKIAMEAIQKSYSKKGWYVNVFRYPEITIQPANIETFNKAIVKMLATPKPPESTTRSIKIDTPDLMATPGSVEVDDDRPVGDYD